LVLRPPLSATARADAINSHAEALESKLNERDATVSKRDAELMESKKRIEKFTEKTREGMQSALNSLMKK
jgi:hypothetical protein